MVYHVVRDKRSATSAGPLLGGHFETIGATLSEVTANVRDHEGSAKELLRFALTALLIDHALAIEQMPPNPICHLTASNPIRLSSEVTTAIRATRWNPLPGVAAGALTTRWAGSFGSPNVRQ